jgi:hypothetical protein
MNTYQKKPNVEFPQKHLVLRGEDFNTTLRKATSALECNISSLINPKRISGLDKDKRDILILLLWNTGFYRNYEIAKIFKLLLCFTQAAYWCRMSRCEMKKCTQRIFRNFFISLETIAIAGVIYFRCVGPQASPVLDVRMVDIGLQEDT